MALKLVAKPEETFDVKDVDLIAGGDPDVSYTLRRLSVPKVRDIYEALKRKNRNNDPEMTLVIDEQLDYIVVDWKGMVDGEGNPLPCDRPHKLGDVSAGLLGLPGDRRGALLKVAQQAAQASEGEKRESFRETESVR